MVRSDPQPPAGLLAWAEETVGSGARVVERQRLTGGLTSNVHRLTVERSGRRDDYVLRWWPSDRASDAWVARTVLQETAVLTRLEATAIPAPRVVGSTTDTAIGGPAILMTRVPGEMLLMPRDREHWLRQIAEALARIHDLGLDGKPFESWLDHGELAPPEDASRPDLWKAAIALLAGPPPAARSCFVHRDYQHFNLLWSGERLTGVVDWAEACVGPPEVDVGHCRLNLAVLFSAEVADRFRAIYEEESGRSLDAWWDIHALMSYGLSWQDFIPIQVGGRAPFDAAGMTARMEQVLQGALCRAP